MSRSAKSLTQFPPGTVVRDSRGTIWRLDHFMAKGGFGAIYIAQANDSEFVIKFELHGSGPLFCEQNFYIRTPQHRHIPKLIALGGHEHNGQQYRFLVLPRLGSDLQKILDSRGGRLPPPTVFLLGKRLVDALEHIHSFGFTHGDIKATNVVTGLKDHDEIYLIDYGLAYRYRVDGQSKQFKANPKKAHDGTLEFTSRDAHKGAPVSPRGDLENLGYCMWQWLCGPLPWTIDKKATTVAAKKEQYMGAVSSHIKPLLTDAMYSEEFCDFLDQINSLEYVSCPDYDTCRQHFTNILVKYDRRPTDGCGF